MKNVTTTTTMSWWTRAQVRLIRFLLRFTKGAGLAVLCLLLAGCFSRSVATYEAPDGTRSSIRLVGTGDKASEIAAEGFFAEMDGAGVSKAGASQQSSGVADSMRAFGEMSQTFMQAFAMGAGMASGFPAVSIGNPGNATTDAPPATQPGGVEYSTLGFAGVPGPTGEGIYGRPSCSRSRAYVAAHPGVELINIDNPENRTAMWTALQLRNFPAATNVALPVQITETGYIQNVK